MTYLDDIQDQQDQQSSGDDLSSSGLRPETTDYLNSLAGIGTQAYLAMRDPDLPEYEDWRDSNFASDDSGNYVSREGQSYSDDELQHMHGFLSRQAGNPFVSGLFDGPDSPIADYMVWRNQNFSNDNGPWEDEDGNLYSEQALQRIFADKSAARPSQQSGQTNQQPFTLPTTNSVEEFFGGQPKFYPRGEPGAPAKNTEGPLLDFDPQRVPPFLPRASAAAELGQLAVPAAALPESANDAWQRRAMSRLLRDLSRPSMTPMGVGPDGSLILNVGPQVNAPSRIPRQFDNGDHFSNINIGYIKKDEGGTQLTATVPKAKGGTDRSGVTIAAGFDIGQHSLAQLRGFGFPKDLTDRLSPYVGLTGQDARDALAKTPLTVTAPEAALINKTVLNSKLNAAAQAFDKAHGSPGAFSKLPWQAQTVIGDLWYNLGDLSDKVHGAPKLWKQVTTGDWEGAYQNLMKFTQKPGTLFDRAQRAGKLLRSAIDSDSFPDY